MIRVTCDNCNDPIDRDDPQATWYGLEVNEPIKQHPDPVQAMNDAEDELMSHLGTIRIGLGSDPDLHFCSAGCLGVWAMNKEMNP